MRTRKAALITRSTVRFSTRWAMVRDESAGEGEPLGADLGGVDLAGLALPGS